MHLYLCHKDKPSCACIFCITDPPDYKVECRFLPFLVVVCQPKSKYIYVPVYVSGAEVLLQEANVSKKQC